MVKQYVFTEEEMEKLTTLIKEAHDTIWTDPECFKHNTYARREVLGNLSDALDVAKGEYRG